MNITKSYAPGDDFIILTVSAPPLPDMKISVSTKALAEGTITMEQQIQLATEAAEARLRIHEAVKGLI